MSGKVAFAKLQKLANPDELAKAIRALNGGATTGYDPRSCMINNLAVIFTVTNNKFANAGNPKKSPQLSPLGVPQGQTGVYTSSVMDLLKTPVIVAFSIKFVGGKGGDHYFSAFPLDDDTIIVSMGWQGIYDFSQWFNENDGGRFKRSTFELLMGKAEGGDLSGIEGLCGFLGTTSEGKSIPATLHGDIAGSKPRFHSTGSLPLPAR